uniref:ATP synthase subunit a n=1 Tax=Crypturopus tuberculatus TaxID=686701 RepID=A0A1L5BW88_9CRUS|nr:ATP synthase F0 subunit 6 [Crypturopus tuberculatus]
MMTNIFSIFDPSTPSFFSANWLSISLGFLVIPPIIWASPSRVSQVLSPASSYVYSEFAPLVKKAPFILVVSVSLLTFIAVNNVTGLLPYVFTGTSQLTLTLSIAIPMWLALMMYGWFNNWASLLAHLIPQGTPTFLMPFMVLIETVSNMIRPLTLAVRLTANMVAGHLLIVLLNSADSNTPLAMMPLLFNVKQALLLLEVAVAFIQAYVFSILVTLYSSEFTS